MGGEAARLRGCVVLCVLACGPAVADTTTSGTSSSDTTGGTSSSTGTPTSSSATSDVSMVVSTNDPESSSGAPESSSGATLPDLPGCPPLSCGGQVYGCTDGEDNDDDGLVDLLDPECVGVCDDDEDAFDPGLPGDSWDCRLDCWFDGNSGSGDDMCSSDLRCDPEDPGAQLGCEYQHPQGPDDLCSDWPQPLVDGCVEFCQPFVLPGCDCFGCCTFTTADGPRTVFLESHPECRLDNLSGCASCTSRIDECGNPCMPEACEICIGESAPPPGCDTNVCDARSACAEQDDCACGEACLLGCCYPLPPG